MTLEWVLFVLCAALAVLAFGAALSAAGYSRQAENHRDDAGQSAQRAELALARMLKRTETIHWATTADNTLIACECTRQADHPLDRLSYPIDGLIGRVT